MPSSSLLAAVAAIWGVAVVTPGPNFLVAARVAAVRSRAEGLGVVAGIGLGTTVWGLSGFFGVHAMFAFAPWLYEVLTLAGAAYLVVMGARIIRGSFAPVAATGRQAAGRQAAGPAFRLGLLTSLSNPKSALFVASLFAGVMPLGAPLGDGLAAVAEMVAISVAWYAVVVVLLTTRRAAAAFARAARWIDRAAGVVFVGFGLALIARRA
jgi:threonine/homoserine/homoserine lactone efflux protein